MSAFNRKDGDMYVENVAVDEIARSVGTPCYIYSLDELRSRYRAYDAGFAATDHLVCYSVKANSNIAVLRALANEGSGFDVVSGGELRRVIEAGGDPGKVVFSGVGKQTWEIDEALAAGILMFNVESTAELDVINSVAGKRRARAPVALRVNPDVDARTHPYISTGLRTSKFGVPIERCLEDYDRARDMDSLEIVGADCHIGSQLTSTEPLLEAARRMAALMERLDERGIELSYIDMGGGLGISYDDEAPPTADDYASSLVEAFGGVPVTIVVEPGRSIAGNAGILVTSVLYHKGNNEKNFIIVDAAMNDLARPSLYSAYHRIEPVVATTGTVVADVVGPVCETGDFLAKDREVAAVQPGGLFAVMSAGAYGFVMSSNYNTRPRAAEVLVDGDRFYTVRQRETVADLIGPESIPEVLKA